MKIHRNSQKTYKQRAKARKKSMLPGLPDSPAMVIGLDEEKLVYMQEILNHLFYLLFFLNVHEHLHSEPFLYRN